MNRFPPDAWECVFVTVYVLWEEPQVGQGMGHKTSTNLQRGIFLNLSILFDKLNNK